MLALTGFPPRAVYLYVIATAAVAKNLIGDNPDAFAGLAFTHNFRTGIAQVPGE